MSAPAEKKAGEEPGKKSFKLIEKSGMDLEALEVEGAPSWAGCRCACQSWLAAASRPLPLLKPRNRCGCLQERRVRPPPLAPVHRRRRLRLRASALARSGEAFVGGLRLLRYRLLACIPMPCALRPCTQRDPGEGGQPLRR